MGCSVYGSVFPLLHSFTNERLLSSFLSGVAAGAVNSVFVAPVELIRNRQQVSLQSKSPWSVLRQAMKQEAGLWLALSATTARDALGLGCYFVSFSYTYTLCN